MILFAAIDWHAWLFVLFAAITSVFAFAVLFSNNVVHMAFYLTLSLGATSGLFFLAGAEFVGAMQLMIYVGGTLVLLVFGVMLTAQKRFVSMRTKAGDWVLAAGVGASLLALLGNAALKVSDWQKSPGPEANLSIAESQTATQIGAALSGVRIDKLDQKNPTLVPGMSGYMLPFVIVSMHLLVVLIGAAYMARTKRRVSAA